VEVGGAFTVDVELSGTGNLPSDLHPPLQEGFEWLTPETGETLGTQAGDKWGGKKTFSFVVKAAKPGTFDLGKFLLPHWDPDARKYEIAEAALGTLTVSAAAGVTTTETAKEPADPFASMPKLRKTRGPALVPPASWVERRGYWLGLFGLPVSYAVARGASLLFVHYRRRAREREGSVEEELRARRAAADAAAAGSDARAMDAATMRLFEVACLAGPGVNVRGIVGPRVAAALVSHGVASDVAARIEEVYRAAEASRFSPSGEDAAAARERLAQAKALCSKLGANPS
jgi:hypothetical protein